MKPLVSKFKNALECYVTDQNNIEHLHLLRTSTRRLLSNINKDSTAYTSLRTIIKMSNGIRDIDVFMHEGVYLFPKKSAYLISKKLLQKLFKQKKALEAEFLAYLQTLPVLFEFDFTQTKTEACQECILLEKFKLLKASPKHIHKLRLQVKKQRYYFEQLENAQPKRIKKLTQVQTLLGTYNDSIQTLSLIRPHIKEKTYVKLKNSLVPIQTKLLKKAQKKLCLL